MACWWHWQSFGDRLWRRSRTPSRWVLSEEFADADYVIVHKLDRLARNRRDDVDIAFAIKAAGAELVSCTENIDDTPSGVLMHSIMAGIAEFYSKNLAVNLKKGLHQKAKSGGTPGRAPLGYNNVTKRIDGREVRSVEIDPEVAEHIVWMLDTYATGEYSLSELTAELEARGLRTRATPKVAPKPIQRSRVWKYLQNPYHIGVVTYGGVQYEGNHEPLIDLETWRRVQDVLEHNRHAGDRTQTHQHYLKGTIYCGQCGARMAVSHSRGRHGAIYPYFFRLGRNKKHTECSQPFVQIETVEAAVANYYKVIQLPDAELEAIAAEVRAHIELTTSLNARKITRQGTRLTRLDNERRKLLGAHYDGAIPLDLLKEEQARIATETRHAERIIVGPTFRQRWRPSTTTWWEAWTTLSP